MTSFDRRSSVLLRLLLFVFTFVLFNFVQAQDDATCAPGRNCKQGCCSTSGNCGFGPAFCGQGNCTSTCDAKAECGQYAPAGSEKCPLGVCCSKHGYCGTTSLFCEEGCQNGCTKVSRPTGSGTSARAKTIAYYESWSYARGCDSVAPEDIDPTMWTHINFAFALIDPGTFKIAKMNSYDDQLYSKVVDLKLQSPGLRVYIAVGGWSAGGKVFSDMTSTEANRKAFINSAIQFCKTYGFDGIDIDWEYPAADDRGGKKEDFDNYVTFMKELKSTANDLGVTLTLPNSYWYLKGFDVKSLEEHVDWFNIMSYDIHGTWDGANKNSKKEVNPHTNITEISMGLDLLWRNGISNKKVVLGLGFYGRSFTLKDASCAKPGHIRVQVNTILTCPFASGGVKGECSGESGILSNAEIRRIIEDKKLTPTFDKTAGIKWITWDSDQWVSYDDADTFKLKMDFANKLGLAGTMVWALDLDNKDSQAAQYLNSGGTMDNKLTYDRQKMTIDKRQAYAGKVAWWTPCMSEKERKEKGCPGGYHEILVGHGKTYDAEQLGQSTGCHGKQNRLLCLNNEVVGKHCNWNRKTDGSKICDKSCPKGTIFLTQNTHPAGDKTDCGHGTYISVCCEDLQTIAQVCPNQYTADWIFANGFSGSGNRIFQTKGPGAKKRNAKKKKKRASDGYNQSNPCNSNYYYNFPQPNPVYGYLPVDGNIYMIGGGSGVQYWGSGNLGRQTVTSTSQPASHTEVPIHTHKVCPGERYPQLCANWRSVATNYGHRTLACPRIPAIFNPNRDAVSHWSSRHHTSWKKWISKSVYAPYAGASKPSNCQVDEWPPYDLWGSRRFGSLGIYVRYLPGGENGGASSWRESRIRVEDDCGAGLPVRTTSVHTERTEYGVFTDTVWIRSHYTSTRTSIVMSWRNIPVIANDPDLLTANICWPDTLLPYANPGFALNDYDEWWGYDQNGLHRGSVLAAIYRAQPAPAVTQGKSFPTKRSVELLVYPDDTVAYIIDTGNSTRPATPSDIADSLGLETCQDVHCTQEKDYIRNDAIEARKRRNYLDKHKDVVDSMLYAGKDISTMEEEFRTSDSKMVVTDTSTGTANQPGATASSPSRETEYPTARMTSLPTASYVAAARHLHAHAKAHVHKNAHRRGRRPHAL